MNRFWKVLLLAVAMSPSFSWASTEVIWIRFQLNHVYNDLEEGCNSPRTGSSLYFAAEIEDGKLAKAAFHNTHRGETRTKSINLGVDTLKQIELFRDSGGKFWIKKLPLDGTLLKWILFNVPPGTFPQICLLPRPLQSISPNSILYEFEPQDFEEFRFSSSKNVSVNGLRQDGSAYTAKIQLVEREFQYGKFGERR